MKRTLTLGRETLADLAVDELTGVVGAAPAPTGLDRTCPLRDCLNESMPPRCE